MNHNNYTGFEIAVIGMACRFPGASNVHEYWENLKNGVESVSVFSDEELREYANREEDITNPKYIKSKGLIEGAAYFDASFFGFSPNEANALDPQIRILTQTAYHALEDAGYGFGEANKNVGVFVGALPSVNWQLHCFNNAGDQYSEQFSSLILNDKDFAATRLSYLLNLHGPSSTIYTACSTSLVTIDMACQSLLTGKSNIAMAGGVALSLPYKSGYLHEQGMIMSKDGHTRSFDENASGTVWSDGVGIVVLKRLEDAINDGNQIHAVIKGSGVNNDGNRKIGYTAPSIQGQIEVIEDAMNMAEVSPESISYIEGHGSATSLGDKIEISALSEVFKTVKGDYKCPIASVKSNIGHLNTASGIAGFIKVCLMLKHSQIPPSVHFEVPNSTLIKTNCPFYVNNTLQEWKSNNTPLRAGVSSFGIGGTNAHIILEEAPTAKKSKEDIRKPLVILSAKTHDSLQNLSVAVKDYILQNPSLNIDYLTYTLQVGRQHFQHRKAVLFEDIEQLAKSLSKTTFETAIDTPKIVMMFPGMGTIYSNLGKDIYLKEYAFRKAMDQCFSILKAKTGQNYKTILYPENGLEIPKDFQRPQLLIFAFEYSLFVLLKSWGIIPNYVVGYSLGEYVAACVSEIFTLESAFDILIERGRLINTLNTGGMLAVPLSIEAVKPFMTADIDVAINNGKSIVVAAEQVHLQKFKQVLEDSGTDTIEINASYALHSSEMRPILSDFQAILSKHTFHEPTIPMISNATGDWCDANVTETGYWTKHLSETIEFHKGLTTLIKEHPNAIFLEVGAGNSLSLLARRTGSENEHQLRLISLVKKAKVKTTDHDYLLKAIGTLWQYGGKVDWKVYNNGLHKNIISLPNYSFEKKTFDIVPKDVLNGAINPRNFSKRSDISSWFYVPTWQRNPLLIKTTQNDTDGKTILIFGNKKEDTDGLLLEKEVEDTLIFAEFGNSFSISNEREYVLDYNKKDDIIALFKALEKNEITIDIILDVSNIGKSASNDISNLQRVVTLFQGISKSSHAYRKLEYCIVVENVFSIYGNEQINPWNSTLLSATKVIPQENPFVQCRFIEIDSETYKNKRSLYYQQILKDQESTVKDKIVSYKGTSRWIQNMLPYPLASKKPTASQIQHGGTYLIIGGLGDLGYIISKYLLEKFETNIILIGRSQLPKKSEWEHWLQENNTTSSLGSKITKAANLAKLKGTVEFVQADSTNYEDLTQVFEKVQAKFSQIDGVFHSAGAIAQNSFNVVNSIDEEQLAFHFPVKTKGLEVIQKVVGEHPVTFVAIMSSLSSILGGLGMIGYAGANQYMDSMVKYQNNMNSSTKWMTFNFSNWEGWDADFEGLLLSDSALETFITADEGEKVFNGLFSKGNMHSQIIISPVDLLSLKEKWENTQEVVIEEKQSFDSGLNTKPELSSEYKAPSTDLEKELVHIWEEIFGFEPIGILDDFMELGGDSLKAITMLSHVHGRTTMTMSIQDFFNNTTIEKLSRTIRATDFNLIPKIETQDAYPVTASQHRTWIVSQLEGGSVAYNLVRVVKLKGNLDYQKFQKSFSLMIHRHESLRTYFKTNEKGEVRQFIKAPEEVNFVIEQLDFKGKGKRKIDNYLIEEQNTIFDFTIPPLFKAKLLKTGKNEYFFSFVMHHIISDGWSMEVLISEIIKNYNNLYRGKEVTNPELRIQYKDYTLWKANQKVLEAYKKAENFWLAKFQGDIPVLELPSFKKRPKSWNFKGKTISYQFSESFLNKLKEFSREQDVTMFMTLMTAINVLLYRYTKQEDIIIGTPVAGREHMDIQNQIGLYLNTLAIRTPISNDSFTNLLQQQKQILLEAFDHQNYPLDDLMAKLDIKRDTSRSPLFDILVVLQSQAQIKAIQSEIKLEDVETIPYEVETKTAKFDLTFFFVESDTLELSIQYNKDIYDKFLISRIFKHLESLIEKAIELPKQKVASLCYISKNEQKNILKAASRTTNSFANKTIIEFFEDQVKQNPKATALVFENTQFNYLQLNECVNKLAHYLIDVHEVQSGELIGIKLKREEWIIISILAVLKTGAAYVPLDYEYPEERIDYIKNDSKYKLCIDSNRITVFKELKDKYSGSNKKLTIKPDDTVCVIYTSGTTGYPKGVLMSHFNISNYIFSVSKTYDVNSEDKFILFSNTTFDASLEQIFLPLTNGGCLHVLSKESLLDTDSFMTYLKVKAITHLHATPSFLNILPTRDLKYLKRIISGGESCPVDLVKRWVSNHDFYNKYGPTEATISCLLNLVDKKFVPESKIPIGTPIRNNKVYILDDYLNLVPYGVIGELYIGGTGVTNGYLNRKELTLQKFIENPFSHGKEKFFKTGDLARMLPNGLIEFIERKDNQVKIRGYRIELGEIEKSISKIKDVKQAVVVVKKNVQEKHLVAYYTSKNVLNKSDLHSKLQKMLPDYMIPTYYVQIASVPLTNNGKINRKALPNVKEKDLIKNVYVKAVSTKEKALTAVWSDVLSNEAIGIKDNFYHLGGDSIKAILVISRLKQRGYTLKVEQLLKTPILEDLAELIELHTKEVNQVEVTGEVELTPIQMNFFERKDIPNKNYYNQSILLESKERLDFAALDKALNHLVKHHDALRMVYSNDDLKWSQFNNDSTVPHYTNSFYDLTGKLNEKKEMQLIGEELQANIDISSGILFNIGHFRLSDADRLYLIVHHLVVDGVSWRILIDDLSVLYKNYASGYSIELPLKTDSYQRWASDLKEFACSEKLQEQYNYWNNISNSKVSDFPTDKIHNKRLQPLDASFSFKLEKEITEALKTSVHKKYNTEINDVLLTALGLALKDILHVDKTIVLMEGHGREEIIDQIDISRTVGWFTSKYPFLLDVSKQDGYELVNVKEDLRKVPKKGIGYGILHYLYEKIKTNLNPSIQFNYLGDFSIFFKANETSIFNFSNEKLGSDLDLDNLISPFLMDILGAIVSGQLNLTIKYSKTLYKEKTIIRVGESYKKHLENLVFTLSSNTTNELTPSDITYPNIGVEELFDINKENNIEDIYELSPLQQGLYFHWLKDRTSSDYFEQLSYNLKMKNVDVSYLKEAFDSLLQRHSILRTSFTNILGDVPLQIVHKKIKGSFIHEELSGSKADIQKKVSIIKNQDRSRGFNLEELGLIRLKVLFINKKEYVFVWSFHHIIMDGWCTEILIQEFYKIWIALNSNNQILLPNTTPYANYINWLSNVDRKASISYWKNYLSGIESVTEIPFRKSKFIENSVFSGAYQEEIEINAICFQKIQQVTRDLGITLNTYFQSVWGYLLAKYNNSEESVFGAVVSGRPAEIEGIENMIGLFINTLPVRVRFSQEETPFTFLQRLHKEMLESIPHQHLDLPDIQSLSPLKDDLVNSLFVFENYISQFNDTSDEYLIQEGNISINVRNFEIFEQTNYDFTILLFPKEEGLKISFQYQPDVYDSEYIKKIALHYEKLLQTFSVQTEAPLKTIDFLTVEEKEDIIYTYSQGEKVIKGTPETVIDLFEKQVAENAEKIAITFQDIQLTYSELNSEINKFANYLNKRSNIQKGAIIGIQLHRSQWAVIAMFGILKSGAAYVPIDSEYPLDRIDYIASDSNAQIIINQEWIEEYLSYADSLESDMVVTNVRPEDTVYMIYTSGSTGRPKGVIFNHKNAENLVTHCIQNTSLEFDKVLQYSTISFDVSFSEIFYTLCSGGNLYLIEETVRNDLNELFNFIKQYEITTVFLPMSLLRTIFSNEDLIEDMPGCIQHIQTAGEQVVINDNFKTFLTTQKVTLHNHYGPSETHVSTLYEIHHDAEIPKLPPIGRPIQNTYNYIVDTTGKLQPFGIAGELWIGGAAVGDGYQNREELTKEKFIENPFLSGTKIYKSGDLVKWLPDGNMEFLGRIDRQVKIRGFRVEPSEIEQCMLNIPEVRETVVHCSTAKDGNKQLAAYLVSEHELDTKIIKQFIQEYLPDYMVPSVFMQIESIPLTHNKKIDVKALPAIVQSETKQIIKPVGVEEEQLIKICAEVLHLDETSISMDDAFFDIGGHSIKAMLLISRIRKRLGVALSLSNVFDAPNLSDLAELIKKVGASKNFTMTAAEEKPYYKASLSQRGLYYLQILTPDMVSYNMPVAYQIKGKVIVEKVEKACQQLIMRHESLRTSFEVVDAKIVQKVHEQPHFKVSYEKSSNEDYVSHIKNFLQPFDLSQAPLFRVKLIEHTDEKHLLVLDFHHIISDAFSINMLVGDFMSFYQGIKLMPIPLQYKTYAEWQYSDAFIEIQNEQRNYWKQKLSGTLVKVKLSSIGNETGGANYRTKTQEEKTRKIKEFAKHQKVTLNIFLQAIFNILLSKVSYQENIILGTPMAGRRSTDLENIVGKFVNTVVLLNYPTKEKKFLDFLSEVKTTAVEAFDHQEFPFDELVTLIGVREENGQNPIFNIMFEFQNVDVASLEVEGLELIPKYLTENDSKFDLTLEIEELDDCLEMQFKYAKQFFNQTSIKVFSDNFLFLIDQVITANPRLSDLTILNETEEEDFFLELSKPINDL